MSQPAFTCDGAEESCKWVKATVGLLESLKPATKGVEDSEKRLAAELLVEKLCKFRFGRSGTQTISG